MWNKILQLIILSFSASLNGYGQDIYDFSHSKQYAHYLTQAREYDMALKEYERLLFFEPGSDSLKIMLLETYINAKKYDQGIEKANLIYSKNPDQSSEFLYRYGKLRLLGKQYPEAETHLNLLGLSLENRQTLQLNLYLLTNDWEKAKTVLNEKFLPHEVEARYHALIQKHSNVKYKSRFLAATMSSIIPGLGKIYAKDWKDGLISFVMVSSLGIQAYRGFKKKGAESAYGWIYGGLAFGFHLGNIYGSTRSVKRYNSTIEKKLINDVEELITIY